MRVLSLGWGVQSFGLAAMSALGVLPPVDVAIHADTTHERTATYEFAAKWTPWLEERGVRVVTVRAEKSAHFLDRGVFIPAYTLAHSQNVYDPRGKLDRSCTQRWKIAPLRRWLQGHRKGHQVDLWLGISLDEVARVKQSDVQYVRNVWPFLGLGDDGSEVPYLRDHLPARLTRKDIESWLEQKGIEIPPRSACYFCPFHSPDEWRRLQSTEDWERALVVDERIRDQRPGFDTFLHSARIPLTQVDFRSQQEKGQMELDLFENECSGVCGI